MRPICIHVMNDFGFLWCFCRACIFASRVTFGGFSNFKLPVDKILNQNGFCKVHLLLFNVQWRISIGTSESFCRIDHLSQPKSAKRVYNFPPIFMFLRIRQFKKARLFECLRVIHSNAISLLFHFNSWFAQKLNSATCFARVYKQFLPRNLKITFALIEFHMRCFLQDLPLMHQSIAAAHSPPPGATAGHLQILRCPGAGHLPISALLPSFWHSSGYLSEDNYTDDITEKKQIGSSVKDRGW